jgi:MFS family permease
MCSNRYVFAALGGFLLVMTAGLESTIAQALAQEQIPRRQRRHAFYLIMNFSNLGGLTLAVVTGLLHQNELWVHRIIPAVSLLLAMVSFTLRRNMPESKAWHARAVSHEIDRRQQWRFIVSILFSYSNTAGFALTTYALGIKLYPRLISHFLIISASSAFGIGLLAFVFAQVPSVFLLRLSYAWTFVWALGLAIRPSTNLLAWVGVSLGTSVAFLAENEFKSRGWPSAQRGRMIAKVRSIGQTGYAATLLLLYRASFAQFTRMLACIWLVGLMAALLAERATSAPMSTH